MQVTEPGWALGLYSSIKTEEKHFLRGVIRLKEIEQVSAFRNT